jgi:hypothetical protein
MKIIADLMRESKMHTYTSVHFVESYSSYYQYYFFWILIDLGRASSAFGMTRVRMPLSSVASTLLESNGVGSEITLWNFPLGISAIR